MIKKIAPLTFFTAIILGTTTMGQISFWQTSAQLTPFRLPLPDHPVTYTDLDGDGDPDLLHSAFGKIGVLWIDDDDDMQRGDLAGDMDSDCLMLDRDGDGSFSGERDITIDWGDEDGDGIADLQVIADNGSWNAKRKKFSSNHYFVFIDTDHDGVLNYIDWQKLAIEAWDHEGRCNFFPDYNGQSLFLKAHKKVSDIADLRYNWENPFLFYDFDDDGLTEMTIRFTDSGTRTKAAPPAFKFDQKITGVYMGIDLDNDSCPGNEQDFDMSLKFTGKGFDYSRHVHPYKSLRGLPATDSLFKDPRIRQLTELVYVDHAHAYAEIFKGDWNQCWFVFDEDDDCQRWERVDFYDPLDPFKVGSKNGGLDNNPQADVSGDRGEWDTDFSGQGNLYISPLDGRLHLLGAELGYWRIDQFAHYFQGWQGWRGPSIAPGDPAYVEPDKFATVKYTDTDQNGFIDHIEYDLDGDFKFEESISLKALGLSDTAPIIHTKNLDYAGYQALYKKMATDLWDTAMDAVTVAKNNHLNTEWYAFMMHPKSLRETYSYAYWLNFYLQKDLIAYFTQQNKPQEVLKVKKAYYSSNWKPLLNHTEK